MISEYPVKLFLTQTAFIAWMRKEHGSADGVWVQFAKKDKGGKSLTYEEAVEVALCFGWIDGQIQRFDEQYWITKFTPRRPRSIWSKRNCDIVTRLIQEKKMKPAGLAQVEAAKRDGRWDQAYDSQSNLAVPDDFLRELKKDKKAYEFFLTLTRANTYAIAWRLQTAKKPETREKRKHVLLEMLKRGEKLH